ncbi:MAG: site-specific DNA-methyltransferase [Desulfosarcinaceae bacterium]|nr:site-specific DNA-methyltransferase [Desulfosarcinaceae bacterium]
MQTHHRIYYTPAAPMAQLPDESVALCVTSPPYPMIQMWDDGFCRQDKTIRRLLSEGNGRAAWERMHRCLDPVWEAVHRVLVPGGVACINIGDATRTCGHHFQLYANHSRILAAAQKIGFTCLPLILWRKQTNAPTKFMGSGMLPAGAYVTLEHEFILVLRKGGKRNFNDTASRRGRQYSAFFWEERNRWFSDVWFDIKGSRQTLADAQLRARSGAYPLELALRLILMYSVQGDTVLDPFLGTGTTIKAAMICARNSVGYEIEPAMGSLLLPDPGAFRRRASEHIDRRLADHLAFVEMCQAKGKPLRHRNEFYGFPVMTRQETRLRLPRPVQIDLAGENRWHVTYAVPEGAGVSAETKLTPADNSASVGAGK